MTEFVYSIAFGGDNAFAAVSGGMLKSMDAGVTWKPVFAGASGDVAIPATAVMVSPQYLDDQTVFAAVSGGVLRSLNGGMDWQSAQFAGPTPVVTALAVSPDFEHNRLLFAATLEDGVFRSADAGSSWVSWNFGLLDFQVLCIAMTRQNQLFAGTATGLFVSRNLGRAWSEVSLPCGNVAVLSLALSDDLLLVGTEEHGLYCSADAGQSWQCLAEGELESVNSLLLDGDMMLAASGSSLFLSCNRGRDWKNIHTLSEEEQINVIASPAGIKPRSSLLMGTSSGNLLRVSLPQ